MLGHVDDELPESLHRFIRGGAGSATGSSGISPTLLQDLRGAGT